MSSKVFRMWPALALALLLAAVWHWGVPAEPASAQDSAPDLSVAVAPEWQWMGGRVTLTGSGFSPGVLAWAFVYSGDGPKDCRSIGVQDNYAGDVVVGDDSSVSFELPVETSVGFAGGEGNYLCLIDRLGVGADLEPVRVSVVVPDPMYRMRLDISSIAEDPGDVFPRTPVGDLPEDFSVVDGRHHDNWNLPQERRAGGGVLLRTSGEWRRCQDQPVEGVQLGCVWDEEPAGGGETGKVYLTQVPSDAATVAVPGASLEFRVSLNSDDPGANLAAERFVIFWGPVDLWQLGARGVEPAPYVIQEEHLVGLRHKIVLQSDLDDDGSVTVTIPRSSRNRRDDTFVAIVPCNDDYLQGNFSGEGLEGAMHMLRDCSEVYHTPVDTEDDTREERPGVREAWSQHEVLSGLGMSCYVRIFNNAEPDEELEWERTIDCVNNLTEAVTDDEYAECMEVLGREVNPNAYDPGEHEGPGEGGEWYQCGMGKHRNYDSGRLVYSGAGRTRHMFPEVGYNAARAFYGFTVKWARGDGDFFAAGCSISLLPYLRDTDGEPYAASPLLDRWLAAEYELDDDVTDGDPRCVAPPEARALSVNFYVPKADEGWSERRTEFYESHPVHFALYVQGMPSAHDYRADDAEQTSSWRRVWLGSWSDAEDRNGPLRPLGFAYPTRDAESLTLPAVSAMTDGYSIEVSRDYANLNGELELYVVPCRPTYSDQQSPAIQSEGSCEDLPERAAAPLGVAFHFVDNEEGPFGVDDSGESGGYLVNYSAKVRVKFVSVSWNKSMARAVSPPAEWDPTEPTGTDCSFASVLPTNGIADDAYWPETTVQGGPCDRSDLSPVRVGFSGVVADNLVVYTTGGRTAGLDLVQIHRATATSAVAPLGRLGIRERRLSLNAGGTGHVLVSPDLAGRDGDVWLVAYSCNGGTYGSVRCPLVTRGRDTPVYDIAHSPAFVVRVRFLPESGLEHTDIGPVCQGVDCSPPMPVLRESQPDGGMGSCEVSSYAGGAADLVYWPDRLVQGGGCEQSGLSPVSVTVRNASAVGNQKLVVFATGGRTPGLETVQVKRGAGDADSAGEPSGAVGLRRVEMSLDSGGSGNVLVDPDLADEDGQIWLLAYLCSGQAGSCPAATSGDDLVSYAVERRPLFQVLVQYDAGLLSVSDIAICRGDSCSETYPLGRLSSPEGDSCGVVASVAEGKLYWPDRVVAGGACDRDDLSEVTVSLGVPSGAGEEKLVVYVTGGRTDGLDKVRVRLADQQSSRQPYLDRYIPFPEVTVSDRAAARIRSAAVEDVLAEKPWMDGNLNDVERRVYDAVVGGLASSYSSADSVAKMPFLDSIDELDYLTVRALIQAGLRSVADAIVNHPEFEGGITDDDRVLVIGAFSYYEGGADDVRKRISRGDYEFRSRDFSTPRTPDLVVTVAVDQDASVDRSSLERLTRDSVAKMEELMGEPLHLSHVLLFVDAGIFAGERNVVGYNYGRLFVAVNPGSTEKPNLLPVLRSTVIHEVAHYYWSGAKGAKWLTEGMAEMAVYVFGPGLKISGDGVRSGAGCEGKNLSKLSSPKDPCHYDLGQHLFIKLQGAVGDEEFRAGIRRLYDVLEDKRGQDGESWIDHLRAAFKDSPHAQLVINQAWNGSAHPPVVPEASDTLGRLGVRQVEVVSTVGNSAEVLVNPDLGDSNGDVWLLAYRCNPPHGDDGCPKVARPASNGYDLPTGPDFAIRVKFTESSGLTAAELREVCRGQECDIVHPWLRQAEPSGDQCAVDLPAQWDFWPDRVVRGGGCYFRGEDYGSVDFRAAGDEKIMVYATGGDERGLELVPVYGLLDQSGDAATPEQLGLPGLGERRIEFAPDDEEQFWVRTDMADDDGNVWLLVYRCLADYGDAGCPLVGRDAIRPSYDVSIRPAFVVRTQFVAGADAGRSSLTVDCPAGSSTCRLTAVFRATDGQTLPGTVEFRVDNGALGGPGSTARVSTQRNVTSAAGGHQFEETLILPPAGSVVNIEAELLGDSLILRGQAGVAGTLDRLSVRVMRCAGDDASCHTAALKEADGLLPGDWFVLQASGYDAAGTAVFSTGNVTQASCASGPTEPWPKFWLKSRHLKSHSYGAPQPDDRGYVGCAVRVSEDALLGPHSIAVSYGVMTVPVQVRVIVDTSQLGFIGLTGPSRLESGKEGEYTAIGYTMEGTPSSYKGGCLKLTLTGPIESSDGGSSADGCLAEEIPASGVKFTVTAKEDVLYSTDASVGVTFDGHSKVMHVLVVPAEEATAPPPVVPSSSHITNLTITPEGSQLRVSWTGSPTADFESLRAQVWVVIGGEDVFLPGCMGGETHDVSTQEVFCMLSYGQSGDVYHAAVGFLRRDGSAVPVETAQWVRP